MSESNGLRLGLCCQFMVEPIKYRTTTVTAMSKLPRDERLAKLSELCLHNANALMLTLAYCAANRIGAFRINSQILPVRTHVAVGYDVQELPDAQLIVNQFHECREFAEQNNIRLSFHPDQFVVLNSPNPAVIRHSLAELAYQAQVAEWVGADTINIHGGGAYGDKASALEALRKSIDLLPERVRVRLTLENDDKIYTPSDLASVCREMEVPLVYDVHHHRCLPDGISIEKATELARSTWNREPLFHVSSPIEGWSGPKPSRHHDYIDPHDFPRDWLGWPLTVDVEAKAKELAVLRLKGALGLA